MHKAFQARLIHITNSERCVFLKFHLPNVGEKAIELTHFPTKHQAFIFRAYEYIPATKIAKILGTTEENIHLAAADMGLELFEPKNIWLEKGYITIIRRMWHILPYEQLFELLDTDSEKLAVILREEDFLDIKLSDKPYCEPVFWRELSDEEKERTKKIKAIVEKLSFSGAAPFDFNYDVPDIAFEGNEVFETRMIYLFSGLYQNAFEVESELYCTDSLLEAYQKLGINGLWTQGVLSQLVEFPFAPDISKGYKERIERMNRFVKRLSAYGIKLYLYLNEPRYMPDEFFEKYPHLKGHSDEKGNSCLCTSTPEIKKYLKDSIASLCRAVPGLGGFFTITRSENLTNCYSRSGQYGVECNCPRCKDKSVSEVISDTIKCMSEGAHSVDKNIKFFAWSWAWNDESENIIRRLPKDVILLSQSELHKPFDIGGVKDVVVDYSMSIVGPGERAKKEWALAKECGLETGAKVQINTTWEASTVPALPVCPSVEKHIEDIKKENVRHILLSWTLGGYPCANVAHAAKFFYEKCIFRDDAPLEAQNAFVKAFSEFPFHVSTLYGGPQNAGPSNLLFEKPTGYRATMTCFAYDDVENWRSIYPIDVFENQFKKLCEGWEIGLSMLESNDESETAVMAHATYCLFKSSLNQIRFIRARNENRLSDAIVAAKDELEVAQKMLELMNKNAAIGFEAANHYYFSKGQLAEKIVNCHYIIDKYSSAERL